MNEWTELSQETALHFAGDNSAYKENAVLFKLTRCQEVNIITTFQNSLTLASHMWIFCSLFPPPWQRTEYLSVVNKTRHLRMSSRALRNADQYFIDQTTDRLRYKHGSELTFVHVQHKAVEMNPLLLFSLNIWIEHVHHHRFSRAWNNK